VSYSDADRLLATSSPAGFAHVASRGTWTPFEHLILLNDALMRVAAGEVRRLIVTMPPRHGKSELISRYLPAWYLGRYPDRQVMLTSYEATFAASWGGKARQLLEEHGPGLFGVRVSDGSAAKDQWRLDRHDGVMVTAGVGGGVTGRGAHLLVIDDPVKNAEHARSQVRRDAVWDWWTSTVRTRLMPATGTSPPGAAIVVMTRWHEDDLVGRLIEHQEQGGDRWEIVNLPALAEEHDPLGRAPGAALCPELFDEAAHEQTRRAIGTYWFASLYQQRPAPAEGLLFKDEHFRYWTRDATPSGQTLAILHQPDGPPTTVMTHKLDVFQVVDVAASSKATADYTVVTTFGRCPDGQLLVLDVARRQFELLDVPGFIDREHERHGRPPLWVENFGHGYGVVKALRRKGIAVHGADPIGDKVMRAMDAVARYEAGEIYHLRGADWLDTFEAELKAFPTGSNDDQVDTVAYAAIVLPKVTAATAKPASTKAKPEGVGVPAGVAKRRRRRSAS